MIFAYMEVVVRDRASDRGCTGGSERAVNVGPPGEIPGGFSFARLPAAAPIPARVRKSRPDSSPSCKRENKPDRYLHTAANEPRRRLARLTGMPRGFCGSRGNDVDLEVLPRGRDSANARPDRVECPSPA